MAVRNYFHVEAALRLRQEMLKADIVQVTIKQNQPACGTIHYVIHETSGRNSTASRHRLTVLFRADPQ
jgi:hypothetical protein